MRINYDRVVLRASLITALACGRSLPATAPSEPIAAASEPVAAPSEPASTLVELRRAMLQPPGNALYFHNMDELFDVRIVDRGAATSELPRAVATPPGFEHGGRVHTYDEFADQTYTNAFLILRSGKILFEDYRNKTRADTRFVAFSVSKTIVCLLVGLAVEKGAIRSIEDPVEGYVPELAGSGYDGSSIRSLLEMRSGVDYEERYDFGENPSLAAMIHEGAVVRNEERFADRARTLKRKAPPGERFNYATMDTAVLGLVIERATGKPLAEFMSETLWKPAGMEFSGFWLADGPPSVGRELSGMGYNAALRDFGRLGQLMLAGGRLEGRRIVPEDWIRQATTIKPLTGNEGVSIGNGGGYGYCLWRIDDNPGAYSAVGLAGQFIYVHPASSTVIVKLSYFPPGPPTEIEAVTFAYFDAITRWQPAKE